MKIERDLKRFASVSLPNGSSVFFSSWSSSFIRMLRTPHEMSQGQIMRLDAEDNANRLEKNGLDRQRCRDGKLEHSQMPYGQRAKAQ
jgi:hypothetical protein